MLNQCAHNAVSERSRANSPASERPRPEFRGRRERANKHGSGTSHHGTRGAAGAVRRRHDQIIPSDWLKRVERTGFGAGLFSEWRENSDFVLNQERYEGANILVAGSNFGPALHASTRCGR
jgi:hypothetical protein